MATGKQRRTFISYSRVNEGFAIKLATELKLAGYRVWLDQLDIPTGARWDEEIEKALHECGIFLAILTPSFVASENAKDEIGYAIDHGKRILPVLLQECEIPLRIRRFQYIDFTKMNYGEGVKRAKEMLAKLVNEESVPRPANLPKDGATAINEDGLTRSGERPTQPSSSSVSQPASDQTSISPRISGKATKSTFQCMSIVFGIALFAVLILIAGLSLGSQALTFIRQPPTSTSTQEIKPTDTSKPTIEAATDTPIPSPDPSIFEEFDSNIGWEENWERSVKHGNERNIRFSIENGEADWLLNDRYLSVYYFYKQVFKYIDSGVQLDVELKNLRFLNTKIDDPEISSLSMICGYNAEGWYEVNFNGGRYKIVRRAGYQQTRNLPPDGGLRDWNYGDKVNKITLICKNEEISFSVNGGKPFIFRLAANDSKFGEGQIGIALTSDKDFPVSVQILSIRVSKP